MIYLLVILITLLPLSVQAAMPDEEMREIMNEFKERLDFEKWPETSNKLFSQVDLYRESISGLENATQQFANANKRRLIEIYTDNREHEYCSRYIYWWKGTGEDDLTISLFINTSAANAREYLIYMLLFSQTPVYRDTVAVAGEVSFFNGAYFVRNNVIVAIGALGNYNKAIPDFAKEVDKILLQQKTYAAAEVMPHLSELSFEKYDTQIAKISFTSIDPREGKADWEYRLSRGSIYKKEENALYLNGRLTGEFDLIIIAVNESGFTSARSLSITATEDDIFN